MNTNIKHDFIKVSFLIAISIAAITFGALKINQLVTTSRNNDITLKDEIISLKNEIASLKIEVEKLKEHDSNIEDELSRAEYTLYDEVIPAVRDKKRPITSAEAWQRNRDRELREAIKQLQLFRMNVEKEMGKK